MGNAIAYGYINGDFDEKKTKPPSPKRKKVKSKGKSVKKSVSKKSKKSKVDSKKR